jgi:hypothetical protein
MPHVAAHSFGAIDMKRPILSKLVWHIASNKPNADNLLTRAVAMQTWINASRSIGNPCNSANGAPVHWSNKKATVRMERVACRIDPKFCHLAVEDVRMTTGSSTSVNRPSCPLPRSSSLALNFGMTAPSFRG